MNSDQEQSITNLVKIHSLIHLLKQDHEQLLKQSLNISYYHSNIDRDKAEQLLKIKYLNTKLNGLFLLRDCTTSKHDFSLSLICNDKCYHYKIQLIYDIYFSIGKKKLTIVFSFVCFYRLRSTNSWNRKFNTLLSRTC
jgi:hypothetical protein